MSRIARTLRTIRLQTFLFGFLVLFGSLPVGIAAFATADRARAVLERQEKVALTREAEALSQRISARIEGVRTQLTQLRVGLEGQGEAERVAPLLRAFVGTAPDFAVVLQEAGEAEGREFRPTALPEAVDRGITDALREARDGRLDRPSLIARSREAPWVVLEAQRFELDRRSFLLLAALPLPLRGAEDQEVFLIDTALGGGRVLWSANVSSEQLVHAEIERSAAVQDSLQIASGSYPVIEYPVRVGSRRRVMIGQLAALGDTDWAVLVQKRKSAALQAAQAMGRSVLLTALAMIVLALIFGAAAARLMSAPFARLSSTSQAIAAGRFGEKVPASGPTREMVVLGENFNRMSEQVAASVAQLREAARENRDLFLGSVRALLRAVEAKEPYTRGHSERVATYSQEIARHLSTSVEMQEEIWLAGLLHDVGKIGIRDQVLNKGDVLTDEEFTEMKRHPVIGAEIMSSIEALSHLIPAIRSHHEKWAGGGYPDGLRGEEIPMSARIVAVADTFDAVTTQRVYQNPYTPQEAVAIIRRLDGQSFDPRVVRAFLAAFEAGDIVILPAAQRAVPVPAPAIPAASVMHT
ncbi:MAG: HD domain-containing protein [Acidobacteria bacterium]|nr:MAG: HD domain-containing protein [Acidobacteriota bacterium]